MTQDKKRKTKSTKEFPKNKEEGITGSSICLKVCYLLCRLSLMNSDETTDSSYSAHHSPWPSSRDFLLLLLFPLFSFCISYLANTFVNLNVYSAPCPAHNLWTPWFLLHTAVNLFTICPLMYTAVNLFTLRPLLHTAVNLLTVFPLLYTAVNLFSLYLPAHSCQPIHSFTLRLPNVSQTSGGKY